MDIHIYGERNSGTGFLEFLLRRNIKNNISTDKKHAMAISTDNDDNTLYIIIFKNLEQWLISTYHYPHHMKKNRNFKTFLMSNQRSTEKCPKQQPCRLLCCSDNTNIFNIRYNKMKNFLNFFIEMPNAIIMNLEYLQNNTFDFLKNLEKYHKIELNKKIDINIPYTKRVPKGENIDKNNNRIYNININNYKKLIDEKKNIEYEDYIKNLRIINKKGNVIIHMIKH